MECPTCDTCNICKDCIENVQNNVLNNASSSGSYSTRIDLAKDIVQKIDEIKDNIVLSQFLEKNSICIEFNPEFYTFVSYNKTQTSNIFKKLRILKKNKEIYLAKVNNHEAIDNIGQKWYTLTIHKDNDPKYEMFCPILVSFGYFVTGKSYAFMSIENRDKLFNYLMKI
jgi:hypothetical protein